MKAEVQYDIRPERVPAHLQSLAEEIRTYFRELPRLLDEGQEGKAALIKGPELISIWDTAHDASQAGLDKFGIKGFMAQPIRSRDLEHLAKFFLSDEQKAEPLNMAVHPEPKRTAAFVSSDRRSIRKDEVPYDIRPERVPEKLQPLAEEICTYFRELPHLLEERQEGKVALIKGSELYSVWDTYEDASQAGVDKFSLEKHMTQRIDSRHLDELAKFFLPEEKRASA